VSALSIKSIPLWDALMGWVAAYAGHHLAAGHLGGRQKLAGGGSGAWPCWIVQSAHDQNKTGYLASNSFAE